MTHSASRHCLASDAAVAVPLLSRGSMGLSSFLYVILSSGAILAGGLIFRLVVYRAIGPDQAGVLALSLSIISVSSMFITLGFPVAIVKFCSSSPMPSDAGGYILTGTLAMIVHGLGTLAVLIALMPLLAGWLNSPDLVKLLWAIIPCTGLTAFISFWEQSYNGMLKFKESAGINLTNNIAKIVVVIALMAWLAASAEIGLLAILVGNIIAVSWGVALIVIIVRHQRWKGFTTDRLKDLYAFGLYQFGTMALELLSQHAGVLLTAGFLSHRETGLYSTAALVALSVWVLPSSMQRITYPKMSEYWAREDKETLQQMLNSAIRFSLVISMPTVFLLFYLRSDVIVTLFGSAFEAAAVPLGILLVGYTFNAVVSRPVGGSMGALNKPSLDLVRAIIWTSCNIGLSMLLIPRWGMVGAAVATTTALVVNSVISTAFVFKFSQVPFPWTVLKPGIILGSLFLLLVGIPVTSDGQHFAVGIIGAFVLGGTGWAVGLTGQQRQYLRDRFKPVFH